MIFNVFDTDLDDYIPYMSKDEQQSYAEAMMTDGQYELDDYRFAILKRKRQRHCKSIDDFFSEAIRAAVTKI